MVLCCCPRERGEGASEFKLTADFAAGQAKVGLQTKAPESVDSQFTQAFTSPDLKQPNQHTQPVSYPHTTDNTAASNSSEPVQSKPKWRAMVSIAVGRRSIPVLTDSGCTGSCISHDYFVKNPAFKKTFVPHESVGRAINGSDVSSIGEVRLDFYLEGVPMSIPCKVTRGLIDPVVLGWDWMSKYEVSLDAAKGMLHYVGGNSVSLIPSAASLKGSYYRVFEDLVLPPHSKVHTDVELVVDNESMKQQTPVVVTEPFSTNGSRFWAARTISRVRGNQFRTELLNNTENSVKVEAGHIVGFAEFVDEEQFDAVSHETEMSCSYGSDDPGYESGSDFDDDDDGPSDLTTSSDEQLGKPETPLQPPEDKAFVMRDNDIPAGAKPLKIDYSGVADDAKSYIPRMRELFEEKHAAAFSKHDRDYGKTSLIQFRAHVKDPEMNPIAQPPYRTRPEMREVIDNQAHQMIADGLVGHSTSPFAAPIMLSKKKCGGWRFLTDFRKINERCNKVVFPLPRIEDSIQKLDNPRFFSSMDLTKGFWQIPVHPDDRKFFAFSTENLHLEYLVAPMGSKNSPSYLSSLMQLVLRGLPIQHVISYLDDILIADSNMEDHLKHLDLVLSALAKAGLKLNPSKCAFARESVVCLGHKLSREGVSPDPANIEKIKSWKPPTNAKKLKAFLGLTGYYRQFVKGYSNIAGCLTDLTRDDVKWTWEEQHQKAFETLRDALVSDLVMCYPNFDIPFTVKTDASLTAIGFILSQRVDGKEKVISYGSKKLSRQQQRWSTYDREFFALISGIRANAHYLRHAKFFVITDHRPLLAWKKVDQKKDPTGRRTRWAIELDNYDFELQYKKGSIHSDADAMSRRGDEDDEIAEDQDDFCLLFDLGSRDEAQQPVEAPVTEVFLGMEDDDEYSLAKVNSDEDEMKRLRDLQDEDTIIAEVKRFLKDRVAIPRTYPSKWYQRNAKHLVLRDGILYRKTYADVIHDTILQAVIPDAMVAEVLEDLHGSEFAGHPGAHKMLQKVHRFAIWPSATADIKQRVNDCKVCDQLREQVPKPRTPLQPIVARRVFDHVMCDLVQFPPSRGFKYVLIFKDVFSGFIKCYKLRNKTTEGVVRAFEDLVCSLGPPKLLTSDNGGEFISEALKQACSTIGVEKRTSVPYRPQSQGNVERQNRTLIKELQQRLIQYGASWVDHLPFAEWTHNTNPSSRTRMSPYFVFFGREPYLPAFAAPDATGQRAKETNSSQFLTQLSENMRRIRDEADKRSEEKRRSEAETYNRKAKHAPFEAGDKVWEYVDVRNKLQPKWSGPITITSRRSNPSGSGTTYTCERDDGSRCRKNYEQLKKVNARYEELMKQPLERKKREPSPMNFLPIACFGPPPLPPAAVPPSPLVTPPRSPPVAPASSPPAAPPLTPPVAPHSPTASAHPSPPTSLPSAPPTPPPILSPPSGHPSETRPEPSSPATTPAGPTPSSPTLSPSPLHLPPPTAETASGEGSGVTRIREEELGGSFIEEPPTGEVDAGSRVERTIDPSISQMTASELNLGFLADTSEAGPSGIRPIVTQPVRRRQINRIGETSQFATPNPPPHPLAAPSPGVFYTPSSREYQAYYAYHHADSPDTPAPFAPRDTGERQHRPGEVVYFRPPQPDISPLSGEVDSDPETPTNHPEPHAIYEVEGPTAAGYMVESEAGDIPVTRIAAETDMPQPLASNQDQPVVDPRDRLRTKIRVTRDRSSSRNQNYPQEVVTRARNARDDREPGGVEKDKGKSTYQRHAYRGPDGKFARRTDSESNQ